jgi:uncharacterized phage protein (TIGR02218 family)
MAGRMVLTRIAAVVAADVVDVEEAAPGAAHAGGTLRWIGGANSGLASPILNAEDARLTLAEPPPQAPAAGDLVEISEGCDKMLATCSGRFGNAVNFRGEPHLPGIDLLTRYPGA